MKKSVIVACFKTAVTLSSRRLIGRFRPVGLESPVKTQSATFELIVSKQRPHNHELELGKDFSLCRARKIPSASEMLNDGPLAVIPVAESPPFTMTHTWLRRRSTAI